jgi:hypothetical protein
MGFDLNKCLTEVYEGGDVEDTVGVEVMVLDVVAYEHPLEEVAGWQCKSTLHEQREHRNHIRGFLHRVRIASGGAPHIHFLLMMEASVDQGEEDIYKPSGG